VAEKKENEFPFLYGAENEKKAKMN